jgi:hypothetical protein
MAKYHKDIFIPDKLLAVARKGVIRLHYAPHAIRAAQDDRYGPIKLPETLDTNKATIIEVEIEDGGIKVLYRAQYSDTLDICIPVLINKNLAKTVWGNMKNDRHKTLDRSKYTPKPR